jgi:hypothetical protein
VPQQPVRCDVAVVDLHSQLRLDPLGLRLADRHGEVRPKMRDTLGIEREQHRPIGCPRAEVHCGDTKPFGNRSAASFLNWKFEISQPPRFFLMVNLKYV